MTRVDDCTLIELPKFSDPRGSLTFVEGGRHLPFPIARVFYIYDVPAGADRGAHAHKALDQALVCLGGSLEVHLDDGERERIVRLDRPSQALHIPPMIWASEKNFAPGSVCLVLVSLPYDESDYYRERGPWLAAVHAARASR